MSTHLVFGDVHAHPQHNNDRASWLSNLIQDVKPDVVVDIGDGPDMSSLSSYDKGLKYFYGRNYKEDITAFLDFQDKLWGPIRRKKKKLPRRVYCVGNHDYRIERALAKSPELQGAISMKDLELEINYDDVVDYHGHGTPGLIEIDNIGYAHYVVAGVSGKALASIHQGFQLVQKRHKSTTVGHQHVFSYDTQPVGKDQHIHGLCIPCMTDYPVDWAGTVEDLWTRGVIIKRNVEAGNYDLEYVSLARLKKEYG